MSNTKYGVLFNRQEAYQIISNYSGIPTKNMVEEDIDMYCPEMGAMHTNHGGMLFPLKNGKVN